MIVSVILSEDLINCFKQSARLGDYNAFFEEHNATLNTVESHLKSASCPKEYVCNFVSMNSKKLFEFLKKWKSNEDSEVASFLNRRAPELFFDIKNSLSLGNWDGFYWKYRYEIDYMIQKARDQRVIDFKIECFGAYFDSLEDRDKASGFRKPGRSSLPDYEPQNLTFESPSTGEPPLKRVRESNTKKCEATCEKDTKLTKVCAVEGEVMGIHPPSVSTGLSTMPQSGATGIATGSYSNIGIETMSSSCHEALMEQIRESNVDPEKWVRMVLRSNRAMLDKVQAQQATQKCFFEQKFAEQEKQIAELKEILASRDDSVEKKMNELSDQMKSLLAMNTPPQFTQIENHNPVMMRDSEVRILQEDVQATHGGHASVHNRERDIAEVYRESNEQLQQKMAKQDLVFEEKLKDVKQIRIEKNRQTEEEREAIKKSLNLV